jgi:membrane-associated HD superfamily phosphohydrolase
MAESPKTQAAEAVEQPSAAERFRTSLQRTLGNEAFHRWAMLAVVSLLISTLAYPRLLSGGRDWRVGEVATTDAKASRDFLVEDKQSTEVRRQAAAEASPPVYDLDEEALAQAIRRLSAAGERVREMERGKPAPGLEHAERIEFEDLLGVSIDAQTFRALRQGGFDPEVQRLAIGLASRAMVAGVGRVEHERPIVVREIVAGQERQVDDPTTIPNLKEARKRVKEEARNFGGKLPPEQVAAAGELGSLLIAPNLTFNKAETELRRARARERVRPVFFQVRKGETIIREGEQVRPEDLLKLDVDRRGKGGVGPEMVLGMAILLAIFLALTCHIADVYGRRRLFASNRDLLFLCASLLLVFLTAKLALFVGEAVGQTFPYLKERAVVYALPVAAGAMLVGLFLGLRQALFFSLAAAVSVALLTEAQLESFLYFYIGCLVGATSVGRVRERPALVRTGLVVGVTNMIVVAALDISGGTYFTLQGPLDGLAGLVGGLSAGVLVVGLTPVVEMVFG